jgi:hypothetical protein
MRKLPLEVHLIRWRVRVCNRKKILSNPSSFFFSSFQNFGFKILIVGGCCILEGSCTYGRWNGVRELYGFWC